MAEMLIDGAKLDACNTAEADAIRAKTGGSSPIPYDYANNKGFADAIDAIPSGGTTITDGIVITARDANGYATAATFYGTVVQPQQFYNRILTDGAWKSLSVLTFANTVTEIKSNAFRACHIPLLDLSSVETFGANAFQDSGLQAVNAQSAVTIEAGAFLGCTDLTSVYIPKVTNINKTYVLRNCAALQNVQIGSVGYGVTNLASSTFQGDTQSNLTIIIYTKGSYVDTAVANARNSATNAIIIIKASENTTYNGTSYAAGDTILTSEVA